MNLDFPERQHFLTPSGTTIAARFVNLTPVPGRDAESVTFEVSSSGFTRQRFRVVLDAPPLIHATLSQQYGVTLSEPAKKTLALVATLDAMDRNPNLAAAAPPDVTIELHAESVPPLLDRPKLSDGAVRRYIARRAFDVYRRHGLNDVFSFDGFDQITTGVEPIDIARNAQVLGQEGYLDVLAADVEGVHVRPTAKLVRAVERYGAAPEDVVSTADYRATLQAYPAAHAFQEPLILERGRYEVAHTGAELISVFRALAPIVEGLVRELLRAHGSNRAHPTLGPMIQELQQRGIGSVALWSRLNHVLSFSRDLAEHGEQLPEPVLRIASEDAFDLVLHLAALFPR